MTNITFQICRTCIHQYLYKSLIAIISLANIGFYSSLQAQVLTETVSRFGSITDLAYKMTVEEKPPLSDNIFNDTLDASVFLSANREAFKIRGTKTQEVYDGNKLIKMNLNTLTYSIANSINNSIFQDKSLPYIISELRKDIESNALIRLQKDRIADGRECFHVKVTSRDTVLKNKRVYITREVLIDKGNYLPVYYRTEQQGFIDGTDILVNIYSEIRFYNYQLNRKDAEDLSAFVVPSEFSMEKPKKSKPLLEKGSKAPGLHLTDANGNLFQLANQKGKAVLLNFTVNSCPHCLESITMLNDLYSRYGKKNFTIVTINPFADKAAIEKYNKKWNIKYPIFINIGTSNADNYNVESYPTFYLIDKNGNIVRRFSGYDKPLENELNNLIKEHL